MLASHISWPLVGVQLIYLSGLRSERTSIVQGALPSDRGAYMLSGGKQFHKRWLRDVLCGASIGEKVAHFLHEPRVVHPPLRSVQDRVLLPQISQGGRGVGNPFLGPYLCNESTCDRSGLTSPDGADKSEESERDLRFPVRPRFYSLNLPDRVTTWPSCSFIRRHARAQHVGGRAQ